MTLGDRPRGTNRCLRALVRHADADASACVDMPPSDDGRSGPAGKSGKRGREETSNKISDRWPVARPGRPGTRLLSLSCMLAPPNNDRHLHRLDFGQLRLE